MGSVIGWRCVQLASYKPSVHPVLQPVTVSMKKKEMVHVALPRSVSKNVFGQFCRQLYRTAALASGEGRMSLSCKFGITQHCPPAALLVSRSG